MGKYTSKIDFGEVISLVHQGLVASNAITEDTKILMGRDGPQSHDFVIVLEHDSIDGNEEEWAAKKKAENWQHLKSAVIPIFTMVGVLIAAVVIMIHGIPYFGIEGVSS